MRADHAEPRCTGPGNGPLFLAILGWSYAPQLKSPSMAVAPRTYPLDTLFLDVCSRPTLFIVLPTQVLRPEQCTVYDTDYYRCLCHTRIRMLYNSSRPLQCAIAAWLKDMQDPYLCHTTSVVIGSNRNLMSACTTRTLTLFPSRRYCTFRDTPGGHIQLSASLEVS